MAGTLPTQSDALQAAAQALISAFSAVGQQGGCAQLASGSGAVYDAVHAFKVAWNTAGWGADPVPSGTQSVDGSFDSIGPLAHNGLYDGPCAAAVTATGAGSYPACAGGGGGQQPNPNPNPGPIQPTNNGALRKGLIVLAWVLIGGAVLGVGWYLWRRFGPAGAPGVAEKKAKKKGKKTKRAA